MKIYKISEITDIKEETKEITVATVVKSGDKVLILKRGGTAPWMPNMWNLPVGGVEEGESLESAAIRECQEESGITIKSLNKVSSFDDPSGFTLIVFSAEPIDINVSLNFESSAYVWVDLSNYMNYDYVPYVKQCILSVLKSN